MNRDIKVHGKPIINKTLEKPSSIWKSIQWNMSRGQNDVGPYSRCDGTDLECECGC